VKTKQTIAEKSLDQLSDARALSNRCLRLNGLLLKTRYLRKMLESEGVSVSKERRIDEH